MRYVVVFLSALACSSAMPCLAAPASPAQATYDMAQAAQDKNDWSTAADGFRSLIPANPGAELTRPRAVIASRLAVALVHLSRFDEARVMGERAVRSLPEGDPELPEALLATADASRAGYDYPAAAQYYRRAMDAAAKAGNVTAGLSARAGFAVLGATLDPGSVQAVLSPIFSDKALMAGLDKVSLAYAEDLSARAAMNAGDLPTALKWINKAVQDSGGLSTQVTLAQIAIRNDAAIISSLRKNDEETRKYLTYTGAGHLTNSDWIHQYDGALPVCGLDADVRPDDTVVVQFSIADDGHVTEATPLYASRTGLIGATFAQSVSQWQWDPAALKGVKAFWRNALVLQLRCQSRPSPEGFGKPVHRALNAWLSGQGVDTSDHPDSFVSPADPRLAMDGPAAIPALLGRIDSRDPGRKAHAAQLRAILDKYGAPPSAYALLIQNEAGIASYQAGSFKAQQQASAASYGQAVPAFRNRYPDDVATAFLLLNWALTLEDSGDFRKAYPLLQSVAAMPDATLPQDAPMRKVALLHIALVGQRLGDPGAAHALASSGISADECTLFDTHPIATSMSIASSQFPQEAYRWHFEGHVKESYDIGEDGHVANVRTIVAYPPFIFSDSTEQAVRQFRYIPPKIGDTAVGCSGETQSVNYRIPG
jgi:tetratricopeptide (TPR) repeat protein